MSCLISAKKFRDDPWFSCYPSFEREDRMYAIVLRYKRPLSEIDKHVDAHRAWLGKNYADGTFLVSGRQRSGAGGFIFAAAAGRGQLDATLAQDPIGQNDLAGYENIEVAPRMGGGTIVFFVREKEEGVAG